MLCPTGSEHIQRGYICVCDGLSDSRSETHGDRMRSNGDGYQLRTVRRKVRLEENWLRARLWASTAIFHWNCFIALMKSHGEAGAEEAPWQGDGPPPPPSARVRNGKRESTK